MSQPNFNYVILDEHSMVSNKTLLTINEYLFKHNCSSRQIALNWSAYQIRLKPKTPIRQQSAVIKHQKNLHQLKKRKFI